MFWAVNHAFFDEVKHLFSPPVPEGEFLHQEKMDYEEGPYITILS
jgi:hypothetical protein